MGRILLWLPLTLPMLPLALRGRVKCGEQISTLNHGTFCHIIAKLISCEQTLRFLRRSGRPAEGVTHPAPPFPPLLFNTRRHIHEGSIIKQSEFGLLPDGWVIVAIIDAGCYEPHYLGLMPLECRRPTPFYHLVPWWIVHGKVVCTDTHSLPLILCTLLALLRLLPLA